METETMQPEPKHGAIEFSKDIDKICAALAEAHKEVKNAERDSENPYFNSTYASLASVLDSVRGVFAKHGLFFTQGQQTRIKSDLTAGEVDVTTRLFHSSGQWFQTTVTLPIIPMSSRKKRRDGEDNDNDADRAPGKITSQAVGSALTYGRRYTVESLGCVAAEAEDDDGNSASGREQLAPIPANGLFEDVIESVEDQTKPKKDGGTFVVCLVKTGKHGTLECFDRLGAFAKTFAGTAQVVAMKAERGKYGPKLLEVHPVEAPHEEEIDPETKQPYTPGVQKARGYMRSHLAACKTEAEIDKLLESVAKSGTAYQSPKVTILVTETRERIRAASTEPGMKDAA